MYFIMKSNFTVFTFDKNEYGNIIGNIVDSRFYIGYLDYAKKIKEYNPRYNRYLDYKCYIYSKYLEGLNNENNNMFDINDEIAKEIYENYFKADSEIDDYCLREFNPRIIIKAKEDGVELEFRKETITINTIEDSIYGHSILTLERLGNFKIDHLGEEFVQESYVSFVLPSFLAKYKDSYLEPVITLNIYNCGLIILETTYIEEEKDRLIPDNEQVMNRAFESVKLHKIKPKYKFNDFFESINIKSANIHDITNHYYEIIREVSGHEITNYKSDFYQYSTGLVKFNGKKYDNIEMLKNNRDEIITFFNNTYLSFAKSMSDKDKVIEEYNILERKSVSAYCNDMMW